MTLLLTLYVLGGIAAVITELAVLRWEHDFLHEEDVREALETAPWSWIGVFASIMATWEEHWR